MGAKTSLPAWIPPHIFIRKKCGVSSTHYPCAQKNASVDAVAKLKASKKPTKTKLKKELWKLVATAVKARDGWRCWRCGKTTGLNCSHILPKGEFPRYEFEEDNLKTLCMHCHLQWWHKNPIQAALWLAEKFPRQYARTLQMAKDYPAKGEYTEADISSKIEFYKRPITW